MVKIAANGCLEKHNLRFVLYDGLRTYEAQEAMMKTKRVLENPHWLEPPRLLSPAGAGGHPRAMAVDIGLETPDSELLDMGCAFDYLAENSHKEHNSAHREFAHTQEVLNNREILDNCMIGAAEALNLPLLPLPEEWWDFRMPVEFSEQYAPIHESDLPEDMRLLDY